MGGLGRWPQGLLPETGPTEIARRRDVRAAHFWCVIPAMMTQLAIRSHDRSLRSNALIRHGQQMRRIVLLQVGRTSPEGRLSDQSTQDNLRETCDPSVVVRHQTQPYIAGLTSNRSRCRYAAEPSGERRFAPSSPDYTNDGCPRHRRNITDARYSIARPPSSRLWGVTS